MRNKKLIVLFSVLIAVTLLIILNSVLFSVQHIDVHCVNAKDSQYADKVSGSHKIRKGSSIFFVDKAETIKNVENSLGGAVRVTGVEKKFPNRIYIDYVEVHPYLRVSDGYNVYCLGNDMRVMTGDASDCIELKYSGALPLLSPGDEFTFASGSGLSAADVLTSLFDGLEQIGYYDTVVNFFSEIDLSGNFIVLKTSTGIKWEIVTADKLAEKLRLAMSVYEKELDDTQRSEGTLVVAGKERIVANYRRG